MKIKILIALFLIGGVSVWANPSVEERGKLIVHIVALTTARQELPFFLRLGIKRAEQINATAQELQAALTYQKQQVAQAHDAYEKRAQTMILHNLQRMAAE